jgi:hypothetical protein
MNTREAAKRAVRMELERCVSASRVNFFFG